MARFTLPRNLYHGKGSIEVLKTLQGKRAMVCVGGGSMKRFGFLDKVVSYLQEAGMEVEVFEGIEPDPSVDTVMRGAAAMQKFQPDWIVAMGGGSPIDAAKAMWVKYEHPETTFEDMIKPFGLPQLRNKARFVAIPSTSGSGSEVTDFAILTHDGVKHPLVDRKLLPDMAILDSNLLDSLPKSLIADAGFDILAHALESYVATGAGAISRALAADAVKAVFAHLPDSFAGDTGARLPVHQAATMAGIAFSQSGLGLCHAMSHALGGQFHIPHGRLNAILLPAVMEANAAANPLYAHLARGAGLGGAADTVAVRNLKNALVRLRKELNLPATLSQAGIPPREVRQAADTIVSAALADPCSATNPVKPDEKTVRHILQQVTGIG